MITRRRSRAANNSESVKVEAMEAMDPVDDFSDPSEVLPAEDIDSSGVVLEDLLGFEDITWTLERDSVLPLFDMELADLGIYCGKDQDSGFDASVASSPERVTADLKMKHRQMQSSCVSNKNAIAARLNRLKKKEYVNSLEKKIAVLSSENNSLKQENSQLGKRVEELEDETRYLRAVLANESMLAQLLSRLSGVNGMKLSSSLFQGPDANDHDYALPRKRAKVEEKETSGGVCLHVDKNHVSVEFCTKCAERASTSLKM